MSYFYLISFLPLLIGLALLAKNREVVWGEFIGSAAVTFALAGIFHFCAVRSATGDKETWSGQITKAIHHPRWVEMYTTTETTGSGKNKRSKTTTHYRTHSEYWSCASSTEDSYDITETFFGQIQRNFNDLETEQPYKSGFYSGDRNVYVSYNRTGYVYPTNTWREFENRLRAVPNLFEFAKVPQGIYTFPYPVNADWLKSDRLVGSAATDINIKKFDQLNARIGPAKKANFILVGFTGRDDSAGHYQQSAWFGGKKNDLVLCYDADSTKPAWAFCFGWTESEIVKRTIESIAIEQGVSDKTLPAFEQEIVTDFTPKNWHKFEYISIPAPTWAMIWFPFALLVTQVIYWIWALTNEFNNSPRSMYRYRNHL